MNCFRLLAICLLGAACGVPQVRDVTTSNVFSVNGFSANANALACSDGVPAARALLMSKPTQTPLVVRFEFTPTLLLNNAIPAGSRLLSYELHVVASVTSLVPRVTLQRSNTTLQYANTQFVAISGFQETPVITTNSVRIQPTADWNNVSPTGDGAIATLNSIDDTFKVMATLTFALDAVAATNVSLNVDCCLLRVTFDLAETTRTTTTTARLTTSTTTPTTTSQGTPAATTTTTTLKPAVTTTTVTQRTSTTPPTTTTTTTTRTTTGSTTPVNVPTSQAASSTIRTNTLTTTQTGPTLIPTGTTASLGDIVSVATAIPITPGDTSGDTTESTDSTSTLAVTSTSVGVSSSSGVVSSNAPIVSEPPGSADNLGMYIGIGIGACLLLSGIVAIAVLVNRKRKRRTMALRSYPPEEDSELTSRAMTPKYSAAPTITDIAPVISHSHYGTAPRLGNNNNQNYDVGSFETQKV
jgi:hypothetical protein